MTSGDSHSLSFGANTFTVTCADSSGNTASATVHVTRTDNENPVVHITAPADNSSTTSGSTTITFTSSDNG